MEVILIKDVNKLGLKDEVLNVKDCFARNYLIPKKLAVLATKSTKKILNERIKQQEFKDKELIEKAHKTLDYINNNIIEIKVKVTKTNKLFGSVTNLTLTEELSNHGILIDKKNIYMSKESIKELGNYTAKVKIFRNIGGDIKFKVVASAKRTIKTKETKGNSEVKNTAKEVKDTETQTKELKDS